MFLIKAKNKKITFVLGVRKELSEGVNKIFREKKFHRGIHNQKLGKVKKFQVWVVKRFF